MCAGMRNAGHSRSSVSLKMHELGAAGVAAFFPVVDIRFVRSSERKTSTINKRVLL